METFVRRLKNKQTKQWRHSVLSEVFESIKSSRHVFSVWVHPLEFPSSLHIPYGLILLDKAWDLMHFCDEHITVLPFIYSTNSHIRRHQKHKHYTFKSSCNVSTYSLAQTYSGTLIHLQTDTRRELRVFKLQLSELHPGLIAPQWQDGWSRR